MNQKIIGYRAWRMNRDMKLVPQSVGGPWEPGVNEARCHAPDHPTVEVVVPDGSQWEARRDSYLVDGETITSEMVRYGKPLPIVTENCECGFHSWFSTSEVRAYDLESDEVVGITLNWGRIAVHPEGMRSQYSQILALCVHEENSVMGEFLIREVAKQYGVAIVTDWSRAESFALEHGATIPKHDRPRYENKTVESPKYGGGITVAGFSNALKSVYSRATIQALWSGGPMTAILGAPMKVKVYQVGDIHRELQRWRRNQALKDSPDYVPMSTEIILPRGVEVELPF